MGCGPAEERLLLTGLHAVADIYCENCHTTLGWKYVSMLRFNKKCSRTRFCFAKMSLFISLPCSLIIIFSPSFYFPLQEQAFELSQKYKEGKFIIELSHMIKDNGWD